MLEPSVHRDRRKALRQAFREPVLLMGNGARARNLPMTHLPFRQDSTFLYFIGHAKPGAAALLVDDRCVLFVPVPEPGDELWHGPTDSLEVLRERLGVDEIAPVGTLEARAREVGVEATLAVADEASNATGGRLTGQTLRFGKHHGSHELVRAVIALRRPKSAVEIAELRRAAAVTDVAHRAVMAATRPGITEQALAALFHGVLAARGCTTGYGTILTQNGEILHKETYGGELQKGRLLLVDGGAEVDTGYGADVTRTWPVSGTFEDRQRAAYEAVLAAQEASIAACTPGTRFRAVHDASSRVLARFLRDEGLLRVSVDEALETGAHALFFPHGVGHLLGLDVHDLENFRDLPAYPSDRSRPDQFGTRNLRLDLDLEAGWVVTVEPGFYVVPAILADPELRERFARAVDFERAADWLKFGGIRIEDDVLVTARGPDVLTASIPKSVSDLEGIVGRGPPIEALLC